MFSVLIAGSTPGLVARLELSIQGAPGRSCDYFCFSSKLDVVALLILEILCILISLTGSGLKSVLGKCNNSNCELDQQGDFLKQILFKVPTELQGAGSIELRLNGKTISIISIHVGPVLKIEFGPPHADFGSVWLSQKARKYRQMQQMTKMGIL